MSGYFSYDFNFTLPELNIHLVASPLLRQLVDMKNPKGLEATIRSCALVCLAEVACVFDLMVSIIKTGSIIIKDALSLHFDKKTSFENFQEVYHLAFVTLGIIPKLSLTGDVESLSSTFPKKESPVHESDNADSNIVIALTAQIASLQTQVDKRPELFKTTTYLANYAQLTNASLPYIERFSIERESELKKSTHELLRWTHHSITDHMKAQALLTDQDAQKLQHLHKFYSLLLPISAILGTLPTDIQINFVIEHFNTHLETIERILNFEKITEQDSKKCCYKKIRLCFAFLYLLHKKKEDSNDPLEMTSLITSLINHILKLFNTHLKDNYELDLEDHKSFPLDPKTLTTSFGYKGDETNFSHLLAHYQELETICRTLLIASEHIEMTHKAAKVMANSVKREKEKVELQQAKIAIQIAAAPS